MKNVLLIAVAVGLVLFLAWRYARRRLTDQEFVAWEKRAHQPLAHWLRMVVASFVFVVVAMIFSSFAGDVIWRRRTFSWRTFGNVVSQLWYEPLATMFVFAVVIGSLVFSFWYWNGIALYRARLVADLSAQLQAAKEAK